KKNTCLCILSYDSAITARIPSKYGPLAAQSLEDPDPYSLPTRAIKAVINFSDKIHNTPAPSITLGLLVFVQLVIAAITTEPCFNSYSFPSYLNFPTESTFVEVKP
ncbi:hypothetical protein ALC57_05748, partial [Trachymyrmex cornetzi]